MMTSSEPLCPCNGCTPETGRSPHCHAEGQCNKGYTEWKRQHEAILEARDKARVPYIKSSMYSLGDMRLSSKHFGSNPRCRKDSV